MPSANTSREFELVFEVQSDSTVKVHAVPPPCKDPSLLRFRVGDSIAIRVGAEDKSMPKIKSATLEFKMKMQHEHKSPLGKGATSDIQWYAGTLATYRLEQAGKWDLSAKVMDANEKVYKLPDPEFEVGDGDH